MFYFNVIFEIFLLSNILWEFHDKKYKKVSISMSRLLTNWKKTYIFNIYEFFIIHIHTQCITVVSVNHISCLKTLRRNQQSMLKWTALLTLRLLFSFVIVADQKSRLKFPKEMKFNRNKKFSTIKIFATSCQRASTYPNIFSYLNIKRFAIF